MKQAFPFRRRLLDALKNYSGENFAVDFGAGATAGTSAKRREGDDEQQETEPQAEREVSWRSSSNSD